MELEFQSREVKVRLVTDTDNLVDKVFKSKPREAIRRLKAARIKVVPDRRSAIMHNKVLVVDGKAVWTGSANMTPRSLYNHNINAMLIIKNSPTTAKAHGQEVLRVAEAARHNSPPRFKGPDMEVRSIKFR
jgi:phosphatidylserine/phosphatidylglycerophosphate/cardiolipin synthase-like enzyme